MTIHPFMAHVVHAGLSVGPYPLKTPSQQIRGYDAPAREALYVPVGSAAPVGGAGFICGGYERQAPALFNVHPVLVASDLMAGSPDVGTSQKAGSLVSFSALRDFILGKG